MKKILEIAGVSISFDLNSMESFKNFDKYVTDKKPEYFFISHKGEFEIPEGEKKECEFFDLYNDGKTQIQKVNGKYVGRIDYNDNIIDFYSPNPDYLLEYLVTQYVMVYIIERKKNMIFMHGSSIMYKNKGLIFTAKSGVGKSTHTRKWLKYSDSKIINDDKQIIALENNKLYIYPNPWSGKHVLDNNIKSSLDAIIFIKRGLVNKVLTPTARQAFMMLLPQVINPSKNNIEAWDKIIDKMLELNLFILECNMEKEAFDVINKRIEEI